LKIIHITKKGKVDKIDGHVVKMSDAKAVYNLIEKMNKRRHK